MILKIDEEKYSTSFPMEQGRGTCGIYWVFIEERKVVTEKTGVAGKGTFSSYYAKKDNQYIFIRDPLLKG